MGLARMMVPIASALVLVACTATGHAPSPSGGGSAQSGTEPVDHAATRAWVSAVTSDAKALQLQLENLHYDWNAVQRGGSQAQAYAVQLDQIALYNVAPKAAALARHLQARDGHVAPPDTKFERDFDQAVGRWQRVAILAHAIETTAQQYNSTTRTSQAIHAFQTQLAATEALWNSTVASLWSAAGATLPPTVDPNCSPTNKAACQH